MTTFASTQPGQWNWDQAWDRSGQFSSLPDGRRAFGHVNEEVWVRLDWTRLGPADERLDLTNWSMNLDEFEVRFRGKEGWIGPVHHLGDDQPFEAGASPWMPGIELPTGQSGSALVRFHSTNSLSVDLRVERHTAVEAQRVLAMVTMGFLLGFLTLMVLFNTFMVLVVRDRLYLWYSAYLVATMAYLAVYTGFLQSSFPEWKPFQNDWDVPLEALNIVTALMFGHKANDFGRLRGAFTAAVLLSLAVFVGLVVHWGGDHRLAIQIENALFALSLVACAAGATVQTIRGNRMSRFFLVGYSFILVTVLFTLLGAAGALGALFDSYWYTYAIGMGILLETVMFSAALADRVQLLQRELNRHVERSQRLDRLSTLGLVAAQVGHEINTPNHVVFLNTTVLTGLLEKRERQILTAQEEGRPAEEDPEDRAALHESLSAIRQATTQIGLVIEELREGVSRPLDLAEIDLGEVVQSTVRLYEPLWRPLSDRITVKVPPRPVPIWGNRARIQQLLVNLVNNAVQASGDHHQQVAVVVGAGERPVLTVEDEGPGLPDSLKPRADTLFSTTRKDLGGTGLGLSIVAQVAREHQAVLDFASVVPHGLKVTVAFPSRS